MPRAAGGRSARRRLGDAVRAIAAAREPNRVDAVVGHHLAQRRQPRCVGPGEMAVGEEALRMNDQFCIAAGGDDRGDRLGGFGLQRAARRDDGNLHAPR